MEVESAAALSPQGYSPWTSLTHRLDVRALNPLGFTPLSRGPAIWATVLALAIINIGVAATIVALMGALGSMPLWAGLAVTAIGVLVLVAAVRLWGQYLHQLRDG